MDEMAEDGRKIIKIQKFKIAKYKINRFLFRKKITLLDRIRDVHGIKMLTFLCPVKTSVFDKFN